jgi:hypothetical protein
VEAVVLHRDTPNKQEIDAADDGNDEMNSEAKQTAGSARVVMHLAGVPNVDNLPEPDLLAERNRLVA